MGQIDRATSLLHPKNLWNSMEVSSPNGEETVNLLVYQNGPK